jgi:hypothetical protein
MQGIWAGGVFLVPAGFLLPLTWQFLHPGTPWRQFGVFHHHAWNPLLDREMQPATPADQSFLRRFQVCSRIKRTAEDVEKVLADHWSVLHEGQAVQFPFIIRTG